MTQSKVYIKLSYVFSIIIQMYGYIILIFFYQILISGVNLRTGQQGIFPSAYAVDMDYNDFDPANSKVKRERYLLG